ncbi:MAG: hypothetical protein HQK88_09705 [Nitrospirae bacterium]|nr:hypothetical protein [Nitrospirota bacterium]MBF0534446.1 hypothetical protein [Nitrospirota bacterium]MBF0617072.1 hypothetical protein [Nitrospirota bacterium]
MKRTQKYLIIALLIIATVRLFLVSNMSIIAFGINNIDDALFVRLAANILGGLWLGPYNELTLIKGVFFPLFIAANFLIGLPLLLTQHLFYIFAGLVFSYTVYGITKNTVISAVVFAFYTFLPLLTYFEFTRVIRDGIYVSEVVLLFCSLFGMILYRNYKWAVFTGLSLSMFWFTREEGVWVLPSIAIAYFVIFFKLRINSRDTILKTLTLLSMPIVILLLFSGLISYINNVHYGSYTVNELKEKSFLKAYGAIRRIKPKTWKPQVPVQLSTMEEIAKHSPLFAKIKANINPGWPNENGDILGGWFLWAFRGAVARAGYYTSAKNALNFYELLAHEVNGLCDRKVLECTQSRETLMPPIWKYALTDFIKSFFTAGTTAFNNISRITPDEFENSYGDTKLLNIFQTITNSRIYPDTCSCTVRGWAFKKGSPPLQVKLKSIAANPYAFPCAFQPTTLQRLDSSDIVAALKEPSADGSRFEIYTKYHNYCALAFYDNSSVLVAESPIINLKDRIKLYDKNVKVNFDWVIFEHDAYDLLKDIPALKYQMLNLISETYHNIFPYLCLTALLCYFMNLLIFRKFSLLFCLDTILLIGIISRLMLLSIIDVTSFPAIDNIYLSPAIVLLCLFVPLSIIDIFLKIPFVNDSTYTEKSAV